MTYLFVIIALNNHIICLLNIAPYPHWMLGEKWKVN